MLTVLSPAKTLDYETPPRTKKATQPLFLDRASQLVEDARALSPESIQKLMGVSEGIATLNHERFMNWHPEFTLDNAKQAVSRSRATYIPALMPVALTPRLSILHKNI